MMSFNANRPNMDDAALLPDGSPDMSRISGQLTDSLAETIAANPNAVDSQSTFAAQMPGVGGQALQAMPNMPTLNASPALPPMPSQSGGMYMVPPVSFMQAMHQGNLRHGNL